MTPIGPSMQLAFLMCEALAEVSAFAINSAWERWIGPQRFERKLKGFTRAGWFESTPDSVGMERVVRLTTAGRIAALGGRDPEAYWRRPWDGQWRLVLFDVPESRRKLRSALRRKLRSLGFGYLQNSAWITPDPVDALKAAMGEAATDAETLSFLEARPCAGETDADLVLGAWNFRRINRGYELHGEILQSVPTRLGSRAVWTRWFAAECKAWSLAVHADPLLPEALLPTDYRGKKAWQRRSEKLRQLVPVQH